MNGHRIHFTLCIPLYYPLVQEIQNSKKQAAQQKVQDKPGAVLFADDAVNIWLVEWLLPGMVIMGKKRIFCNFPKLFHLAGKQYVVGLIGNSMITIVITPAVPCVISRQVMF